MNTFNINQESFRQALLTAMRMQRRGQLNQASAILCDIDGDCHVCIPQPWMSKTHATICTFADGVYETETEEDAERLMAGEELAICLEYAEQPYSEWVDGLAEQAIWKLQELIRAIRSFQPIVVDIVCYYYSPATGNLETTYTTNKEGYVAMLADGADLEAWKEKMCTELGEGNRGVEAVDAIIRKLAQGEELSNPLEELSNPLEETGTPEHERALARALT